MGEDLQDYIDPRTKNSPGYNLNKQLSALGFQMARQYKQLAERLYSIEKRLENIEKLKKGGDDSE